MSLVGANLGLTRRLLKISFNHLLTLLNVCFSAVLAILRYVLQLDIKGLFDVLVDRSRLHDLLIGPSRCLDRPKRQRIRDYVELFLRLVTLLSKLDLLAPDFTVDSLSVFLCLHIPLLLFIVFPDLVVELLSLFDKHVDLLSQILREALFVVLLLVQKFGVDLEQAEGVHCGVRDTGAQVCCVAVGSLQLFKFRVL